MSPAYNEWLVQHAANAVEVGSGMVYPLLGRVNPGTEERVIGYYAICPTMVVRDDPPKSLPRGVLRAAPAWLPAKLALDRSLRGDKGHQWGAQPFGRHLRGSWPASTWAVARSSWSTHTTSA